MSLRLRRLYIVALLTALVCLPAHASPRGKLQGDCAQGNGTVVVAGYTSSSDTRVQRSYPACTVTIYLSGTVTKATLYSDDAGTPLANPLTADVNGTWYAYLDNGGYDVRLSGSGIAAPFTRGDYRVFDERSVWANVRNTMYAGGARGDGSDDTASFQAAIASGFKYILVPAGSYVLTDQLTIPIGVHVYAYGATLTWTSFGTGLADTMNKRAATGNGVRMSTNSGWHGGVLRMTSVISPAPRITDGCFSGAFWNQIAVGDFNECTTADMTVATENVIVEDVTTELVSGDRITGIFISGLSRNISIFRWHDLHTSTSLADMSAAEVTWGGSSTYTYHPYNIVFQEATLNEYVDPGYLSYARGIHISGAYNVAITDLHVTDSIWPLTFYIGDPGDPGLVHLVNPLQTGKIARNLSIDGLWVNQSNIGLRIFGDANGSTNSERKSHDVRVTAKNINISCVGPIVSALGNWLSNLGVYLDSANSARISGGEIKDCYEGITTRTPQADAAYTAYTNLTFEGLEIHRMARNGINVLDGQNVILQHNTIYDVGMVLTENRRAAIKISGSGTRVLSNYVGRTGDLTTVYGVVMEANGAKTDGTNNWLIGNHCQSAAGSCFGGVSYYADYSNTAAAGVPLGTLLIPPNPQVFATGEGHTGVTIQGNTAGTKSAYLQFEDGNLESLYVRKDGNFFSFLDKTAIGIGAINTLNGQYTEKDGRPYIRLLSVPATATDPCTSGIAVSGAGYLYICIAPNTWMRSLFTTWP